MLPLSHVVYPRRSPWPPLLGLVLAVGVGAAVWVLILWGVRA